jgi:hypothetical protein
MAPVFGLEGASPLRPPCPSLTRPSTPLAMLGYACAWLRAAARLLRKGLTASPLRARCLQAVKA